MWRDAQGQTWFKGNLHTHTTRSDGRRTPEEVMALYREAGYDFLALTDHWNLSEEEEREGLLLLTGCEYDVGGSPREGVYHIVGIGMTEAPRLQKSPSLAPQTVIDEINRCGGLAVLAHPAWSLDRAAEAVKLRGLAGTEIYNTMSGPPWNGRPYSGQFVDEAAVLGRLFPCMAADDAHFYNGDETRSYLWVKAAECTSAALLDALRRGEFFATQGPRFSLAREGDRITVTCSPVSRVTFFSDILYAADRVTAGEGITRAVYTLKRGERFLRVELADSEGRTAWSSPVALS